jgi:hypothetical protein
MKKLALTLAMALMMGTTVFAQQGDGALRRSRDYEAARRSNSLGGTRSSGLVLPGEHGSDEDTPATTPLGGGVVVLVGLGAAYLVGKRRKED